MKKYILKWFIYFLITGVLVGVVAAAITSIFSLSSYWNILPKSIIIAYLVMLVYGLITVIKRGGKK